VEHAIVSGVLSAKSWIFGSAPAARSSYRNHFNVEYLQRRIQVNLLDLRQFSSPAFLHSIPSKHYEGHFFRLNPAYQGISQVS
jgi:hypothetical protein